MAQDGYQIQGEILSLAISVSGLISLLLLLRAFSSVQTGLLPSAHAHLALVHHSPCSNGLPLFLPTLPSFPLNPVHAFGHLLNGVPLATLRQLLGTASKGHFPMSLVDLASAPEVVV